MESVMRVQNLNEAVCISFCSNALGKGINPSLFPPTMGKIAGHSGLFCLGKVSILGGGKLLIQTNCTPLKKLTLYRVPFVVRVLGKYMFNNSRYDK